jgi:hypothetical protein
MKPLTPEEKAEMEKAKEEKAKIILPPTPPPPPEPEYTPEPLIKKPIKYGRPKLWREVLQSMHAEDGPLAVEKARELLDSPDDRTKIWAIEFFAKYSFGPPPKRPTTPLDEIPKDTKDLKDMLERTLAALALDGDMAALLTRLKAIDPKTYGAPSGVEVKADSGNEQKTKLNFVLDGQQRAGHDPDDI